VVITRAARFAILLVLSVGLVARGAEAPPAQAPAEKPPAAKDAQPITNDRGPVGTLLRTWWAEGTAAGNVGDWYDNRDRGHSDLDMSRYPQLQKIAYTEAERRAGRDWAAQGAVLGRVVFGNSSTSGGIHQGGSNPRHFYSTPLGLAVLAKQYANNNLYIYPEHCDYDPGHNGVGGGFGDLYPTNTPYLIISQGSSGSDQPFMHAVAQTLAAFRPDVKRRLVEAGMLAPTIQMVFRLSNKMAAGPKEYLTGRAHPTVFDGSQVDVRKMVQLAHDIEAGEVPPMVQLAVAEEDLAQCGRDYFEPARGTENLGDTPSAIARVACSVKFTRRIVVSAGLSADLDRRPLTFHWVVLRGDASRIRITPRNKAASTVEIVVPYHERRPILPGSPMESNRVDIGAFVHNGQYYSAPAFITFLFLDDEARTYDDQGRPLEVGYGMGEPDVTVPNWPALFDLLKPAADTPGAALLKKALKPEEVAAALQAAEEYPKAKATIDAAEAEEKPLREARDKADAAAKDAEKKRADAQAAHDKAPSAEAKAALDKAVADLAVAQDALKKARADADAARKALDAARKAFDGVLAAKRDGLRAPLKTIILDTLTAMVARPTFYPENAKAVADCLKDDRRKAVLVQGRKRLAAWGLLKDSPGDAFDLECVRPGAAPAAERLTAYEKALLAQFNGDLLTRLLMPGAVNCSWRRNYVDPTMSVPKTWRDVYRYDPQGNCTGWTRYDGERTAEFNADGLAVIQKDARGRCLKARTVRYEQERPKPPIRGYNTNPLKWSLAGEEATYEYAGEADFKGRLVKKEPAAETK
jgi:hypothetical protein